MRNMYFKITNIVVYINFLYIKMRDCEKKSVNKILL